LKIGAKDQEDDVIGFAGLSAGRRKVVAAAGGAGPDFNLSSATVTTGWGVVTVGELQAVGAPSGAYFVLVESSGAIGDEADIAVVNG
jgi:hypothetical protein